MGGFRARDADRERYVDIIEAAYVDGQLGDADRELRVGRALSAETLDELDSLTRDLQNRPVPAAPVQAQAAHATRVPARPTGSTGDSAAGKGVAVAMSVVVGLVFMGAMATSMRAEDDWAAGSAEDYAQVPWEQVEAAQPQQGFTMTPRRVRDFVDAYEAEFATLDAYEVAFFPRRVTVQVPVDGARSRSERWTWDGEWTYATDASAVVGSAGRVDLGAVDAPRLVDNIATAKRALGVERGRFTHALLTRSGDEPAELTIHIGNDFNETGHLSTTPDGTILRRQPYQP